MDTIQAVKVIAEYLNPPVITIILIFSLVPSIQKRRPGWGFLFGGWLFNLLYIYNETLHPQILIFGAQMSPFLAANLSLGTSVLFLAYWLSQRTQNHSPLACIIYSLTLGVVFVFCSLVISYFVIGEEWVEVFFNNHGEPTQLRRIYSPLIIFSFCSIVFSGTTLWRQLKEERRSTVQLICFPWLFYGVLQFTYYLKFVDEKIYFACALAAAVLAKGFVAAGLITLFKTDVAAAEFLRVTSRHAEKQRVAFSWFAHELKNPIHAVQTFAEAILKRLDSRQYDRVRRDAARLVSTANILTSVIESVKLAAEPIDTKDLSFIQLNAIVERSLELLRVDRHYETGEVQTELSRKMLVCGVRENMVQIFTNVIRNALEASEAIPVENRRLTGGVRISIQTRRRRKNGREFAVAAIRDYGSGINPNDKQDIFEPYYSTKDGINRGLGLWVVRNFVEAFNGSVRVESPLSPLKFGTVFEIWLPSARDTELSPFEFWKWCMNTRAEI